MPATKARTRDADATKARILAAAKAEFARLGLGGARVDEIAEKAEANKRMIYHYFGNKEDLFAAVLEDAYLDIRTAEQELQLDELPPDEAMITLIKFTWDYYLANPEFIRLVNSANLHEGKHLKRSQRVVDASRTYVAMIQRILNRGVDAGLSWSEAAQFVPAFSQRTGFLSLAAGLHALTAAVLAPLLCLGAFLLLDYSRFGELLRFARRRAAR